MILAILVLGGRSSVSQAASAKPLLVGYFGQWSLYSDPPYSLKDLAADQKAAKLDQINYAQGFVTGGHCSVADRNADLDHSFTASESVNGEADDPTSPFRGYLHQLSELRRANPHLRALISLEGRASDFAFDAQPEHRKEFITSCVDMFLKGDLAPGIRAPSLFDGIDVDWEYPAPEDAANFLALLTELRQQMDRVRPGLTLSVAVGPSPRMYGDTDFAEVAHQVDQIGLMTYDFAGPWMQSTGFIAPLYSVPVPLPPEVQLSPVGLLAPSGKSPAAGAAMDTQVVLQSAAVPLPTGGASASAQAFLAAGVPASKLLIGVPFYGYGWTQVPEVGQGVFQEGTPIRGDHPYRYIQSLAAQSKLYRDPVSQTPWLFDGDAFWTFDDAISVQAKASYVLDHRLGGLMIWELSDDTPEGTLLNAAHATLAQSPSKAPGSASSKSTR